MDSPDVEQDADFLAAQLRDAAGLLIRRVRRESGTTLTWSQGALLSDLARRGSSTASELAVENGLRPQTVWSGLDTLEKRGLVGRARDVADRRSVRISMTDQGRLELEADRRVRETWIVGALLAEFTSDQREALRVAAPLLIKLAQADPALD